MQVPEMSRVERAAEKADPAVPTSARLFSGGYQGRT
jgi:hypothetical protein